MKQKTDHNLLRMLNLRLKCHILSQIFFTEGHSRKDDLKERVESLETTNKKRVLGHEQIMENDKFTRFYSVFPTNAVFSAFVTYLEPKATRMIAWSGKSTGGVSVSHRGPKPWKNISIQDQLLAVWCGYALLFRHSM